MSCFSRCEQQLVPDDKILVKHKRQDRPIREEFAKCPQSEIEVYPV